METELNESGVTESLESIFGSGDESTETTTRRPDAPPETPEEQIEAVLPEEAAVGDGPAFEIEVEGQRLVVRGEDQIKELLQKGQHYSQNSEYNARVREGLAAQAVMNQQAAQLQAAVAPLVHQFNQADAHVRSLDQEILKIAESDPFKAQHLRDLRDQFKEYRGNVAAQVQNVSAQFKQGQASAAQYVLANEAAALSAKLPEMRNSEKAAKVTSDISSYLVRSHGFNQAEVNSVIDHRMVLVAHKAMLYDRLQQGKDQKVKQVRTAPPVVKPGAGSNKGASFGTQRQLVQKFGKQGNNRAQEALVTKMLERAFK